MQLEESGPDGEANGIRIKEEKAEDQLRPLPSNDSSSKRIPERVHGRLPCCYVSLLPSSPILGNLICTKVYIVVHQCSKYTPLRAYLIQLMMRT